MAMHDHPDRPPRMEERTKIVFANFDRSLRDFMDKRQRDKFKSFYGAYRSHFKTKDDGSVSNLSIPLIAAHIDSFYARLVGMRPVVEIHAREPDDVNRATKQRLLIDYQWDVMKMLLHAAELAKSGLIYGIGWGKCTWRKEARRRLVKESFEAPEEVTGLSLGPFQGLLDAFRDQFLGGSVAQMRDVEVWNDPFYENIPVDQLYPDPDGFSIDSCRYLIHRVAMSFDELEALDKGGGMKLNRSAMGRLRKALKGGSLKDDEVGTTLMEDAADTFGGTGDSGLTDDPTKREFQLLEHWTDERVRWVVSGNPEIGMLRDEPHAIGMKPFIRFTPEPLPNELIGTALTERLFSINLHQNGLTNAHMDNVFKTAHPQVMIPFGSPVNPSHIRFKAGGSFRYDPSNPPAIFEYPELKISYYRTMEFLNTMADKIGGTPTFRGESPEGDTTATEASLLAQASGTKFGAMLQQMNEQPFKRLGRILVRLNELNVNETRWARVIGREASQAASEPRSPQIQGVGPGQPVQGAQQAPAGPEAGFEKITQADLASRTGSELDVTIDVASKDPDTRVMKLKRSQEAYAALAQSSQFDPAMVPLAREVGIRMAEALEVHDARAKVEAGEQALAQQQQQALAQQQAQQQGGNGRGNFQGSQNTLTEGSQLAADQGASGLPV